MSPKMQNHWLQCMAYTSSVAPVRNKAVTVAVPSSLAEKMSSAVNAHGLFQ